MASWLSLVLQLVGPQRNLDSIFACPHMFSIWVQHEGSWMGLGPFAMWQMVDYPNKRTNYLGFPSVHCWEQQRAQQPDRPTVGQLARRAAHTLPFLTSWHLYLPSVSFLSHFSLTTLTHSSPTWQSLSQHKQILEGFCFNTVLLLCLGGFNGLDSSTI